MILSGMTTLQDVDDNAAAISAGKPLTTAEFDAIGKVREILQAEQAVKCTGSAFSVERILTCKYWMRSFLNT